MPRNKAPRTAIAGVVGPVTRILGIASRSHRAIAVTEPTRRSGALARAVVNDLMLGLGLCSASLHETVSGSALASATIMDRTVAKAVSGAVA